MLILFFFLSHARTPFRGPPRPLFISLPVSTHPSTVFTLPASSAQGVAEAPF